jgi:peptidyl-prolyl cis-trans isomerase B (cyclophilin B)
MKRRLAAIAIALAIGGCSPAGLQDTAPSTGIPPGISTPAATGATATNPAARSTTQSRSSGLGRAQTVDGCRVVAAPAPRLGEEHTPPPPAKLRLIAADRYTVTVQTNCGTFAFVLDQRASPRVAAAFYYLVRRGFYDRLTFHRVVRGFVIQGGDPAGNGTGGPGFVVSSPPPRGTRYLRGTVAMAKTAVQPAGTAGSQFFIVTAADASGPPFDLPPAYAVLGHVSSGMAVVQRIDSLVTDGEGRPYPAVVMQRVTVTRSRR